MDKSNSLKNIDGLRGCAAIYVLIHHSRWLLAENYSLRLEKGIQISTMDYILSSFRFGHEAVIFFFVLSGFLIHLSILKNFELTNKVSWKIYFVKRINRIYPPFVICLLFTALLDILGKFVFSFSVYNVGSKYFSLDLSNQNFSILPFLGNLLNLQGLISTIPVFGSNSALWSLSYEWWFYLLYPLFLFLHKKQWMLALGIQFCFFVVAVIFQPNVLVFGAIFQKMLIWWLGVILAEIIVHNMNSIKRVIYLFICFIPLAIIFLPNNRLIGDLFWGLGFMALLNILIDTSNSNIINRILTKLALTGSFSYTLYLIHVPIVFFFHGYLIDKFKGSLPNSYWPMFVVVIIVIFFSWITSKWVEKLKLI